VVFDGKAALTHNLVYAVVYNKTLVKPEDLPKTWPDLLEPALQGQDDR
jgi:ABC-type Fe3+ transport system substrate-binding protein